jgi:hypothetical protein
VEDIVKEGRELQAARARAMTRTEQARVFAVNVACPVCGAAVGELCETVNDWGSHRARYDEEEAEERRRLDSLRPH